MRNKSLAILILLFFCFLPLGAFAQVSIYQPPTPIQKLVKTPGAPGAEMNGRATDEYLREQVLILGGGLSTPAPTAAPIEVTPIAQVIALPTQMPTAYAVTPYPFVNTAPLKAIRINNGFNTDIFCTYGLAASTPIPFLVPAGSQHYENFAANGSKMSSGVSCIHPVATPASGTLSVWGY
jgi:hypothetical protein